MANQVRSLLSTAFNLAEVWGWRPEGTNPCRHVARYRTEGRERFLSDGELSRLSRVLRDAETSWGTPPNAIGGIRLLILTGCRPDEILTLRWEHVDFERRCLNLPDSKTGRKTVYLNTAALQVLAGMERIEGKPLRRPGEHAGEPPRVVPPPVEPDPEGRAHLAGVRLYDLRHTFASTGVNAGLSLKLGGGLLGHSKTATTERYAHLADDPVREANERIGAALAQQYPTEGVQGRRQAGPDGQRPPEPDCSRRLAPSTRRNRPPPSR
jgi:integrase